jgi:Pin2-interacting protein X1
LAAQGWKPGDYLGAENASHADHYTAANASHIRVMLREDNLGLGAQIGKGNAETFGLSMFSGLLGRLNGKTDDELEAQRKARRDAEIRIQHEQRYGHMNFVSGGFLVGDKMETKAEMKPASTAAISTTKRKHSAVDEEGTTAQSKEKKPKIPIGMNLKDRNAATADSSSSSENSDSENEELEDRGEKAEKPVSKKKRSKSQQGSKSAEEKVQKAREKAERRARKEERRKRKEERQARRALKASKKAQKAAGQIAEPSVAVGSTAVTSNGSRHATRQRYIQQKRMASMDPKALKEIFMLQAAS